MNKLCGFGSKVFFVCFLLFYGAAISYGASPGERKGDTINVDFPRLLGPAVHTLPAEDITQTSVKLKGNVNPNGEATTYHFEWGTSTSYGNVTTDRDAGSGNETVTVEETIANLTPGTTYHFRIVAKNAISTAVGNDVIFTTQAITDPMEETKEHFTGWWYDPNQPGTGMAIEIQDNNKLFMAWFVYDENGNTIWYASGGPLANDTTYVGELWKFTGWAWGAEEYSPPTSETVGSVTLVFNKGSDDVVDFSATVGDKIITYNFSPFMKDFAPGDKDSRNITGWWYDPNYNGMGFYLDARGGKMAMVWYNYRNDHSPRWLTSTAQFADGAVHYSGSLDGWKNGQCVGCPFTSPPTVVPGEGGDINIVFSDANHAIAVVDSTTLNLERFQIP